MAKRGRPRNSVKLQLVTGAHVNQDVLERTSDLEIPAPKVSAQAPTWLHKYAKQEWKRIYKELAARSLYACIDESLLAHYCQTYARWREAEEHYSKHGPVIIGGDAVEGQLWHKANPSGILARLYGAEMRRAAADFGITPSGRRGMVQQAPKHTARDRIEAQLS